MEQNEDRIALLAYVNDILGETSTALRKAGYVVEADKAMELATRVFTIAHEIATSSTAV